MRMFTVPAVLYLSTVMMILTTASVVVAAPPLASTELEPMVVTATGIPEYLSTIAQSVTVVERAEIEATAATSIAELLENVSGVDVRQRGAHGSQADVSIRGGSFEQTLILVNGVRLSNPQSGHHNMDIPVDVENIERIEIIKGSNARVYGANAMAGVINIITRRSQAAGIRAQLQGGEHDYWAGALQSHFSTGSWQNDLSAAQRYSSGFNDNEPTGFNIKTMNYLGRLERGNHDFEAAVAYTDKNFGASRFYFDSPDQKEETTQLLAHLAATIEAAGVQWRPLISWSRHEDLYRYRYGSRWYQNETTTDSYTLQWNADTSSRWGLTRFGISSNREEMTSSSLGDHQRNSHSLFLNHDFAITDTLTVGAGASAVYYTNWGWKYWPGIDAVYAINNRLQWFASVAKAFRIPTFTEMYYNSPGNSGDPDLDAEQSWTAESGLRWRHKRLSANLSAFVRDSKDLIDWSRATSSEDWQVRNVATSTTYGIEVGADLKQPLAAVPLLGRLALSYTYLDQDADSAGLESKYSLNNVRHQLHSTFYLDWHSRLSQTITVRAEQRMAGDSNVVVDSKLIYQASPQLTLTLEASNLFNEEYPELDNIPAAGRWIMAGITLQHELI